MQSEDFRKIIRSGDLEKVRSAVDLFKDLEPEIPADGELQFDTAYVPDVARRKAPQSEVAGRANVFVFPDLDSGKMRTLARPPTGLSGAFWAATWSARRQPSPASGRQSW